MKSKLFNALMFAAGAAIGSAVTWKVLKTKYDRIIQEEIDSIKETFAEVYPESKEPEEEHSEDEVDPRQINWDDLEDLDEDETYTPTQEDLDEYKDIARNYTNEKGGAEEMSNEPYVIAPYDFGELDGYSTIELTYYMDNILEDEDYHIVTDADELIGPKALNTFGEYEDDAVFVRNDRLRTDFQILKDYRTYDEARHIGPDRVGDE